MWVFVIFGIEVHLWLAERLFRRDAAAYASRSRRKVGAPVLAEGSQCHRETPGTASTSFLRQTDSRIPNTKERNSQDLWMGVSRDLLITS